VAVFEDLIGRGLAAARPAAGVPGRLYYSTDTAILERDNGSTWDSIEGTGSPADHNHTGTGDGGVLTNPKFDGYIEVAQIGADPTAPGGSSNLLRIYAKDKDGVTTLYYITEGGVIYELPTIDSGGGGGGSGAPSNATYVTTTANSSLSAEALLSAVIGSGLDASKPAAGTAGRLYYATDDEVFYRDNGATWVPLVLDWTEMIANKPAIPDTSATFVTTEAEASLSDEVLFSSLIGRGVAASRPAAGVAGRLYFSTDTEVLERDNGTTWDDVSAGGGGTGIAETLIDAKGDLIVGSAADTAARLAVGTNGYVLKANSAQATGLEWAAESGGGGTVAFSGARVYRSTNTTINNNSEVALEFDSERYDTDGYHSTVTNTSRFTIPAGKAGKYRITGQVGWSSHASNARLSKIRLNGTTSIATVTGPPSPSGAGTDQIVTTTYDLAVGDYVELTVYQLSGTSINVDSSGNYTPEFMLELIGPSGTGSSGDVSTLNFVIDGGGSVITTGIKGDLVVDFACTITGVTLLADQSGSIVVDIWKDTYANFPPVDADSITASAPPTITTATKSQDTTLTGWTTSISAGQILRFNVDSVTSIQRLTVALKVTRS
jgi:hypothetical protein